MLIDEVDRALVGSLCVARKARRNEVTFVVRPAALAGKHVIEAGASRHAPNTPPAVALVNAAPLLGADPFPAVAAVPARVARPSSAQMTPHVKARAVQRSPAMHVLPRRFRAYQKGPVISSPSSNSTTDPGARQTYASRPRMIRIYRITCAAPIRSPRRWAARGRRGRERINRPARPRAVENTLAQLSDAVQRIH